MTERRIQRAILKRMREVLPSEVFWFHVPNQILGPADYGGALIGDGMKPGVPDLILLHRSNAYGLEVKRPGEQPTPAQLGVHPTAGPSDNEKGWPDGWRGIVSRRRAVALPFPVWWCYNFGTTLVVLVF